MAKYYLIPHNSYTVHIFSIHLHLYIYLSFILKHSIHFKRTRIGYISHIIIRFSEWPLNSSES
ncbi:hypothetical protein F383_26211 [Gossypium arboreum]|uniref:Uncharacterized protein n=1 Tax=Gossypium arboreum TaxID=29729 RepID=A0A0B0P578_GOSAR|nr:hypothetical protein F383_26211 [Gossypium arboreum]